MAVEVAELEVYCNDVVGEGDFEKEAIDNFATCAGSKTVKPALTSVLGTPLHPRAASSLQLKLLDDWKLRNTVKMVINPTYLAQRTRSSVNWTDAKKRVIHSYRDWLRSAPEIQTMYSLNMPVSTLRTKMRQEFERHRYVNQLKTVDVLLFNSHQEFQETLNFWKQLSHVLKYFRAEEDPKARLPSNFINGFLEGRN
ncbi:hypothetical protein G6011_01500 [Alternaria panax]|uniref:Uncharacterized protein n=2 Tax=Alternaria TaxID=5598 RepID=A0AAD4IKU8_9PLEO|nr:hypothetical protein G6011_01500 [Alternaria panax]